MSYAKTIAVPKRMPLHDLVQSVATNDNTSVDREAS